MNEEVAATKACVRALLNNRFERVAPNRPESRGVHLEVWRVRGRERAVGIEFDHDAVVNFWVTRLNVPRELPPSVTRADKAPKGRGWTDDQGNGANSNLSAYDQFRTKPISRLGVRTSEDAKLILDHLCR